MAMAVGIAVGLAALLAALILLLAVPVDLNFDVAFDIDEPEARRGEFVIGWLFGLVRVRASSKGRGGPRREARQPPSSARRTRRGGRPGRAVALLRQAEFRERSWKLLRDLRRAARLENLRLRLRLGLGDPADTGQLWAVLGPLAAAAQWRNMDVAIEPAFVDAALDVEARGRVHGVPLRLVAPMLGFALSPTAWRAWRTLGRGHG